MKKLLLCSVLTLFVGFYVSAQVNLLQNADMEERGAWKVSQGNLLDTIAFTFGSTENTVDGGEGGNLEFKVKANGTANTNLSVYQELELVGGEEYKWSCAMRDLSTDHDCWWIKFCYFELEPTDDTDPEEKGIAQMHEWLSGKIYNFNGLFDTCTAAIVSDYKDDIFIPIADGIYYVGVNLGTCDTVGNYHFIVDELALIDQDSVATDIKDYSDNSHMLKLYPNPATNKIDLTYTLKNSGEVELSLVNILGSELISVSRAAMSTGTHTETFDCFDLPDGLYYAILRANNTTVTKKVIITK